MTASLSIHMYLYTVWSYDMGRLSADHPEVAAAIKEAAVAAGSTSSEEYTIKFNVDILAPNVKHADSEVRVASQPRCRNIGCEYY